MGLHRDAVRSADWCSRSLHYLTWLDKQPDAHPFHEGGLDKWEEASGCISKI